AAAAIAVAGASAYAVVNRQAVKACSSSAAVVSTAWNAGEKDRVHAAFLATKTPFAEDSFKNAAAVLDDYAANWSATSSEVCLDYKVRAVDSEEIHARRVLCLEDRKTQLNALAQLFEKDADVDVVSNAVSAARALEDL